jgi:hypothetical protein
MIFKKNENKFESSLKHSLGVLTLLVLIGVSCKNDDEDPLITNSPAYYITQAEQKLASIPDAIKPQNQGDVVMILYATGIQEYTAVSSPGTSTGFAWNTSSTPTAFLFDKTNAQVGTHGAVGGVPFWKLTDSDVINGAKTTETDSPDGAANIKWLLLGLKANTNPSGAFSGVKSIQRITTIGGQATCENPSNATSTCKSNYKAVYVFRK